MTNDKPLTTISPAYVAGLERRVEQLTAALGVVLDHVDYTAGNCNQTEMVGAILPRGAIKLAREVLSE
jgi:hypothetical protein